MNSARGGWAASSLSPACESAVAPGQCEVRLAANGQEQTSNNERNMFISSEDDTGNVQVIVWPHLKEEHRAEVLGAQLLVVYGR